MNKYDNFESFMAVVIEHADCKCKSRYNKSLTEVYKVSGNVYLMILKIIPKGWSIFLALVVLLALGPLAFTVTLATFSLSPIGIAIIATLAVFGGGDAIKILYQNRILPMAIKETGEFYKEKFNSHINEESYIDDLINKAAEHLIKKAKITI